MPPAPPRRGRPPKLTREQVTETAITLLDTEGLDALTMSRLASEHQVAEMTIYRIFPTKSDLLSAVAGSIYANLEELPRGAKPLHHILAGLHQGRQVLLERPGLVAILQEHFLSGPDIYPGARASLADLLDAGVPASHVLETFYLLRAFLYGWAAQEGPRARLGKDVVRKKIAQALAGPDSSVSGLAPLVAKFDFERAFDGASRQVLAGIARRFDLDDEGILA